MKIKIEHMSDRESKEMFDKLTTLKELNIPLIFEITDFKYFTYQRETNRIIIDLELVRANND